MLQINKISKQYKTDTLVQQALDHVSLSLRDSEFVAILGPSGSGKTTLLNIIGGLDRYDNGDLIINGISTEKYNDRDWDSYRNHTVGFIFQSYNLIPHQTILSNVELALTISGISKKERKQKAKEALIEVGLGEHIHKRPNQLSGGQMQRVAIARALVNDPDILLADEPTGALDSATSVQVMELLKEVAKDRLVVMVTHNPELAEEYATRIVKLKDGKIIGDTDPFDEIILENKPIHKNMGKSSMSILTAFSLSLNNLLTKKGRTILTSFAGSIGIIGIALILSLSTGFQNYIDKIQEDTLTSYPLTLTSDTADVTSVLLSMVTSNGEETEEGIVKENQVITSMFQKVGSNDLKSFKKYIEENQEKIDEYVSVIQYSYGISPLIYTKNDQGINQVNPNTLLTSISGGANSATSMIASMSSTSGTSIFSEMLDDQESLMTQYDLITGKWPEEYNEMILILNNKSSISDLLVYCLGLRDTDELAKMMTKVMTGETVENTDEPLSFTYDQLLGLEYKLIDASDIYKYNSEYQIYEDMSKDEEFMKRVYNNSETLKIVGIVVPAEGSTSMSMMTGIAYTKELTQHVIEKASQSEIVKKQLNNPDVNIFSGKRFDEEAKETGLNFQDMISIDTNKLSSAFGGGISEADIVNMTQGYMTEISKAIDADTSKAKEILSTNLRDLLSDMLKKYIEENKTEITIGQGINAETSLIAAIEYLQNRFPGIQIDEELLEAIKEEIINRLPQAEIKIAEGAVFREEEISTIVEKYLDTEYAKNKLLELNKRYQIPQGVLSEMYKGLMNGYFTALSEMNIIGNGEDISLTLEMVDSTIGLYMMTLSLSGAMDEVAIIMAEVAMQATILSKVGALMGELMNTISNAMDIDPSAIASAFSFDLSEDELMRLMEAMTKSGTDNSISTNLISLGYQDLSSPSAISFYFKDFDSKEGFMNILDEYNSRMEMADEDKVIKYTDITGILISSVSVIVDSVSYVLIAFVSISLIVSSIMIGIITYISVLERTKEIGVLRAIGASKGNISTIFNAETFIIGLCSGLMGIGVTLSLIPIINYVIHSVTGNLAINATLPITSAVVLISLSVILTLIGGLIPSKQAAKKDPVTALRSE